jgi:hypothetical protein
MHRRSVMAVSTLPARKEHEIKILGVSSTINSIKWKMTVATTNKTSGLWSSGLWHRVVLWEDINVSEEHAAFIFKIGGCRFKNTLGHIDMLQGWWSWDARRGVKAYSRAYMLQPLRWKQNVPPPPKLYGNTAHTTAILTLTAVNTSTF